MSANSESKGGVVMGLDERKFLILQAIIDDCLSVGLFDTYIYKEYGILTSQAIQEQYHKIITDSRRKYKLPLEQFWLIKEGEDGTENNSAEIRNNINSKGSGKPYSRRRSQRNKNRNQYHSYRSY